MRKSRFSEERITKTLQEKEAGVKLGGMDLNEARRLKHLEDENRPLKHLVADLTLDNQALKLVVSRKY